MACNNPFTMNRTSSIVRSGQTLAEIFHAENLTPREGTEGRVFVNDVLIPPSAWGSVRPHMGDLVIFRSVPTGPAKGAGLGALVAQIALKAALKSILTFVLKAIVVSAISFVLKLIINAIAPPPRPKLGKLTGSTEAESPTLSITGQRNSANHWGPIPVVLGKVKTFPTYGAKPFTELEGNDQYLRLLFDVGYGRIKMTALKIGSTPIDNFDDVTYETREGTAGDAALTLYTDDIDETGLSILLKQVDSWHVQRSEINADELSVDITFQNGLVQFSNQGGKLERTVVVEVEYQSVGGGGWVAAPSSPFTVTEAKVQVVRRGMRWTVAQDQYDVRLRRTTADSTDTKINDVVTWTTLRTIRDSDPVKISNIARVAMRIKATDQLNGVVDSFNLIAESYLDVWDGAAFTPTITTESAWAYLTVMRGPANKRPVPDARIDLAGIKAWNDDNVAAGGRPFNMVVDFRTTVFELLNDIAAMGRASFGMMDGKFSVVPDKQQTVVVQHFTPRNSWDYLGTKTFIDVPHGLKVRFINSDADYQQDERIVYDDNFNAQNATKFEVMELLGAMTPGDAWKHGRYHIATGRLRPEIHEITVDVEHIVCTRGDLVRVVHDVPSFGLGFGRIKTVTGSPNASSITIDDLFNMDPAKSYAVRIRYDDGTTVVAQVNTVAGEQSSLTFSTPITPPIPKIDDLVLFGELNSESVELIVNEISPSRDLTAKLTLIDHAPAVYSADTGTIPPYTAQITLPPGPPEVQVPDLPIVENVRSDETVLVRAVDGSLDARILVVLKRASNASAQPAFYQGRFRRSNSNDRWEYMPPYPADAQEVSFVGGIEDNETYDMKIRAISKHNVVSEWVSINNHLTIGKSSPPPDVNAFFIEGNVLKWTYIDKPRDFAGFRLKRRPGVNYNWTSGIVMTDTLLTATQHDLKNAPLNIQTYMIKAVDVANNESTNTANVVINLGDPIVLNLVSTKDRKAALWPGTLVNGTISGSNELVADGGGTLFYTMDSASMWTGDVNTFWTEPSLAMTYTDKCIPDYPDVPSALTIDATIVGETWTIDYQTTTPLVFWIIDTSQMFWPVSDATLFWPPLTGFVPWPGIIESIPRQKYEFRITTGAGPIQGKIETLSFKLDVPDVTEHFEDLAIAAGGTRLPITKTYRDIANVQVTVQDDGGAGITARIIDKSATQGPQIKVLNSSATAVAGTIDAQVQGI